MAILKILNLMIISVLFSLSLLVGNPYFFNNELNERNEDNIKNSQFNERSFWYFRQCPRFLDNNDFRVGPRFGPRFLDNNDFRVGPRFGTPMRGFKNFCPCLSSNFN